MTSVIRSIVGIVAAARGDWVAYDWTADAPAPKRRRGVHTPAQTGSESNFIGSLHLMHD